jgi:lactobin A/cerein 7B family class IIb bacteriocin
MKKVVSVLVIMAVFSTAVFAAPLSLTGSLDTSSREGVSGIESSTASTDVVDIVTDMHTITLNPVNEDEGLFASVSATELPDQETAKITGGIFPWPVLIVVGALVGGLAGLKGCDMTP